MRKKIVMAAALAAQNSFSQNLTIRFACRAGMIPAKAIR